MLILFFCCLSTSLYIYDKEDDFIFHILSFIFYNVSLALLVVASHAFDTDQIIHQLVDCLLQTRDLPKNISAWGCILQLFQSCQIQLHIPITYIVIEYIIIVFDRSYSFLKFFPPPPIKIYYLNCMICNKHLTRA